LEVALRIFTQPSVIFLLACIGLLSAAYFKIATTAVTFAIEHGSAVIAPGPLGANSGSVPIRKPDGRLQDG